MAKTQRLIVGISGASGVIYGVRLLEILKELNIESHLIMTKAAEMTLAYETPLKSANVKKNASIAYNVADIGAACASGSFLTSGMIVAPCSMRSLAEIANGVTTNLLTRAADVVLKERRPLVLMVRETPLHHGHLSNMLKLTEMGGIIAPPVPAFYAKPQNLTEMIDFSLARVLDLFGIHLENIPRWKA